MIKRMILMILLLAVVFGGIFGWQAYQAYKQGMAMAAREPAPVTVTATVAETDVWRRIVPAIATLQAVQGVDLSTEVGGIVQSIQFESGEPVEKGQLLVELSTATDRAELQRLQAQAELARIQYQRQRSLYESRSVSESVVDEARTQYQEAQARVKAQQALIEKKMIRAPFSGIVGIRQVSLGEYVAPGTTVVTLQALEPIYVNFNLPQQFLDDVEGGQSIELRVDAYPSRVFKGEITAISPKVEVATRTFSLQATIGNEEHALLPGMFGELDLILPGRTEVITVPQTSITYNPYGDQVFIIQEKNADGQGDPALVVQSTFIQVGDKRGDQVAILEGVQPGQRVVTTGQIKLQDGARVRIDNSVTPSDDPTPTPPNN